MRKLIFLLLLTFILFAISGYSQLESITADDMFTYININDKKEITKSLKDKGFYKVEDGISTYEKYRKDKNPPYITEYHLHLSYCPKRQRSICSSIHYLL